MMAEATQIIPAVGDMSGVDVPGLLLGLAWLGEASTAHIRRLALPQLSMAEAEALLRELARQGYLGCRRWLRVGAAARRQRDEVIWALEAHGWALLRDHPGAPLRPLTLRPRRMVAYDHATNELLVRVLELAQRMGLRGVALARSVPLAPPRPQPSAPLLLALHLGGVTPQAGVPWATPAALARAPQRRYTLHADAHGPVAALLRQARGYRAAEEQARLGGMADRFPLSLWLARDQAQLDAVLAAWRTAWPRGRWLLTTGAWLAEDRWIEHYNGSLRSRGLFERGDLETHRRCIM